MKILPISVLFSIFISFSAQAANYCASTGQTPCALPNASTPAPGPYLIDDDISISTLLSRGIYLINDSDDITFTFSGSVDILADLIGIQKYGAGKGVFNGPVTISLPTTYGFVVQNPLPSGDPGFLEFNALATAHTTGPAILMQTVTIGAVPGTATFNNGVHLRSESSQVIEVDDLGSQVIIKGPTDIASSDVALYPAMFVNKGSVSVDGIANIIGDILVTKNTATANLNLRLGSLFSGSAYGSSAPASNIGTITINVNTGSTWTQGAEPSFVTHLTNAGTVSLKNTSADSQLTVQGTYIGGGTIQLDADFAGNSADQLLLDGASTNTSGTTTIELNALTAGAQTTGNGIALVVATNGAQTSAGAFVLNGGSVQVGGFLYTLHRGDINAIGNNWYLRSAPLGNPSAPTPIPALDTLALILLALLMAATFLVYSSMAGNKRH